MITHNNPATIQGLPAEIIQHILSQLDGRSAHQAAAASNIFADAMCDQVWLDQHAQGHALTAYHLPRIPTPVNALGVVHRVTRARIWSDLYHKAPARVLSARDAMVEGGVRIARELHWVDDRAEQRVRIRGGGVNTNVLIGGRLSARGAASHFETLTCVVLGARVLTMAQREDGDVTAQLHTAQSSSPYWVETPAPLVGAFHAHGHDIVWCMLAGGQFEIFARND